MFGGQWKAGLGRILGVTDRTINRWLSGKVEPRPGVFVDLLKVLQERRGEISRLIGATGFFIHQGNLSITFSSARVDHRSDPGPVSRVVVGRVVLRRQSRQASGREPRLRYQLGQGASFPVSGDRERR